MVQDPFGSETAAAKPTAGGAKGEDIVVQDRAMAGLYQLAERVAKSTINVLLLGETGVGKDVMARKIHAMSPRGDKPFLPLNCGALTEQLLESQTVKLLGSKRVPKEEFYSFFQIMMIINDFVCSEIGEAPLSVVVIDSLKTQARNTIRGDAISLEIQHNERSGKHAFFIPVVHSDACTGCGLCEKACILEEAAVKETARLDWLLVHLDRDCQMSYDRDLIDRALGEE